MTPAEKLQRAVALEFKVPCSAITGRRRVRDEATARHVYWYLLNQVIGTPPRRTGPNRSYMGRQEHDWGGYALARAVGFDRNTVRHAVRKIEDLRDDAEFDARISALEGLIEGA